MAMTTGGGGGGQIAEINVTPAIDVLLVLLIIFMVITPLTPKGLEALVPEPPPPHQPETQTDRTVVVQVLQDNNGKVKLKINQEDVSPENLQQRLTDIFKTRAERVMFVKGDPDVEFQNVAQVIDTARGTNVIDRIGLITAKIEAGQ
jgi:biopolymer transport protein TolR